MGLKFVDKWGNIIRLTKERIKHIANHMELHNKLHIIEETLKYPEIVSNDPERKEMYYYQKYLRDEDLFLIIIVKKQKTEGFIITIFKSKKTKEIE